MMGRRLMPVVLVGALLAGCALLGPPVEETPEQVEHRRFVTATTAYTAVANTGAALIRAGVLPDILIARVADLDMIAYEALEGWKVNLDAGEYGTAEGVMAQAAVRAMCILLEPYLPEEKASGQNGAGD